VNLVELFSNLTAGLFSGVAIVAIHKALGWSLLVSAVVGFILGLILGYLFSFLLLFIAVACSGAVRALLGRNESSQQHTVRAASQSHRHPQQPGHDRHGDDRRAEGETAAEPQGCHTGQGEDQNAELIASRQTRWLLTYAGRFTRRECEL
jgi:hypothetical protein